VSFVTNKIEFDGLRAQSSGIFRAQSATLPFSVFREGFDNYRFVDFHDVFTGGFWSLIDGLARDFGDEDSSMLILKPDPVSYYYSHFGRFAALRFHPNETADRYFEELQSDPGHSPADAMLHIASVVLWFGSSQQWGIWGERDWSVAVVGSRKKGFDWPLIDGIEWLNVDEALSELISLNFHDQIVPPTFAEELRRNYSNRV
jgi:hypothetical protein